MKCSSEGSVKGGTVKDRQRYAWEGSGYNNTVELKLKSTPQPNGVKRQVLPLYLEGLWFLSMGRFLGFLMYRYITG